MNFLRSILLFTLLFTGSVQAADWILDNNASRLNFVSIKAGNVAENHTFGEIAGHMTETGAVELVITLDSVDTDIDIRDERMRQMLFDTKQHPKAQIKTQIDPATVKSLEVGQSTVLNVEAGLDLSGQQSTLNAEVRVVKVAEDKLLVTTHTPILLNADNLGLASGIEKLREVAGLPMISLAVPVDFSLTFTRQAG